MLTRLIPGEGTHLGFWVDTLSNHVQEATDWCFSHWCHSLPSSLSKINKYILRWGLKRNKTKHCFFTNVLYFYLVLAYCFLFTIQNMIFWLKQLSFSRFEVEDTTSFIITKVRCIHHTMLEVKNLSTQNLSNFLPYTNSTILFKSPLNGTEIFFCQSVILNFIFHG